VWENVAYMLEMDFGFPGRPSFMDVFVEIDDVPLLGHFRAGQWRMPFGLDAMTSAKELTFIERWLPSAFVPFRQIGVGAFDTLLDESATWAVSGFRFPVDFFAGNVGDDGGYGLAARGSALPWYIEDESLLHVGVGYVLLNPSHDRVIYRNQPEFFVSETPGILTAAGVPTEMPFFVDTGVIPTNYVNLLGAELAGELGPLHFQSELIYALVGQQGGPHVSFPGFSAQAGWFLTGETRQYDRQGGVLAGVEPLHPFGRCGLGAWELAFRYSYLDLTDGNILGGRLNDVTAGLNWHLNTYTKFQFNLIHALLDNPLRGDSSATIAGMRAHFDF
jgi:phosphate-selective porin OprO/OprP